MPEVRKTHINYRAGPANVLVHKRSLRRSSTAAGRAAVWSVLEHSINKLPEDKGPAAVHRASRSPHVRVAVLDI